MTQCT